MGQCCSRTPMVSTVSPSNEQFDQTLLNESKNLEDLTVVWLDATIYNSNADNRQARLRSIINYLKRFDDPTKCLSYILSVKHEKVFLIVSGSLGENFIPQIYELPQMAFIYVFCKEKEKHEKWANIYIKQIRGVFTDKQLLFLKLNEDVSLFSKSLIPTSIFGSGAEEKSVQDLKNESAMYMWLQLLVEILLRIPRTTDAKTDMLEACRLQYKDNDVEQEHIKDFELNYSPNDAILWYTRDTFIYRLLNKAFRTEDIIILFKFRFFIVDLYQQLKDLHAEFVISDRKKYLVTVYPGQFIAPSELEKLKQNVGGLISLNTFVSTTIDREVAIIYSGEGACRPLIESLLFEMDIDTTIVPERPFANIEKLSAMKDEKELLLSMGSIFLIDSVESRDNFWNVKLILCSEENQKLKKLADHYKKRIGDSPTIVTLADHLWSMGEYDKAERFYLLLLSQLSEKHESTPFIYHGLGLVHVDKGDYPLALSYLEKGLRLRLLTLNPNHPDIAQSYNDIAEIYRLKGDYDEALNTHKKALQIRLTSLPADHIDLMETYNNMGLLYDVRAELADALAFYLKAIDVGLKTLPFNHPLFAVTFLNIGNTYRKLNDYPQALQYLEQALEIFLQSLPSNHAEISNTYLGIGSVYLYEKQYEKALVHYKKALEIDSKTLQPDHPDLALTYHNIGQVYLRMGQCEKAMVYFKKTLNIQQTVLSTSHPHLAETYSSIGQVYEKNCSYMDALKYQEKALEIASQCLLPTHDTILKFQSRIESAKGKLEL